MVNTIELLYSGGRREEEGGGRREEGGGRRAEGGGRREDGFAKFCAMRYK